MQTKKDTKLYTVPEIAKEMGYTRGRIWQIIKANRDIPERRCGKNIVFTREEVDKFFKPNPKTLAN